jgi:hypothetical protein
VKLARAVGAVALDGLFADDQGGGDFEVVAVGGTP